ncbi:septum formation inhibitor Maf [Gaetbulibacter aestuarii]|uniref:Septum formation inhibitor Maf n=1 Tax=Gaetbulibacter aestuarii TaxID=1502358 RepID=A0ABW7MZ30_9FLAO
MKSNYIKIKTTVLFLAALPIILSSCNQKTSSENQPKKEASQIDKSSQKKDLSEAFKAYWYRGKAEVTSYKLEQARYGEMRDGHAVLVYVTEDFLPKEQVKADYRNPENISVLKLNSIKKFTTGIYPYSIMQSTFYPVNNEEHAIKVSASIQEWCGQTYMQLNNRTDFEATIHSYFQSEGDQNFHLQKTILENELWTQLRIDPKSLPVGELEIIPSFEYLRLKHEKLQAFKANASLHQGVYRISYPDLQRELEIHFSPDFPYDILSWEETYPDNDKMLTTKATKLKMLKTAYWHENSNSYERLRDTLGI